MNWIVFWRIYTILGVSLLYGLVLGFCIGCCSKTIDPMPMHMGDGVNIEVREAWLKAQRNLQDQGLSAMDLARARPENFKFHMVDRRFYCGGKYVQGCFTPHDRVVRYIDEDRILIHESMHAITFSLGIYDPRHEKFEYPH